MPTPRLQRAEQDAQASGPRFHAFDDRFRPKSSVAGSKTLRKPTFWGSEATVNGRQQGFAGLATAAGRYRTHLGFFFFLKAESNMVCVDDMYTVHIDVLYSTIWNRNNRCHKRCTMMYRAPHFGSRGMDRMGGFLSFRDRAAEAIPGAEEAENPADTVFRRRFSSFFFMSRGPRSMPCLPTMKPTRGSCRATKVSER